MPAPEVELPENAAEAADASGARRWAVVAVLLLALVGLGVAGLWLQRENLARRIIAGQLDQYDLRADYRLDRVEPLVQVLSHVVVGDPARPDFVAERVEILITPTFGLPTIGSVRFVRPRLYGQWRKGALSFGELDKVLFAPGTDRPAGLPDLDLRLEDARARIDTDFGSLGIKAQGRGNLRNSFVGQVAAIVPQLTVGGCRLTGLSAYGAITSKAGAPRFSGPLRLGEAQCPGFAIGRIGMQAEATAPAALSGMTASGQLASGPLHWSGQSLSKLSGKLGFSAAGAITADYDLSAQGLGGLLAARSLNLSGAMRSSRDMARIESDGRMAGDGLRPGQGLDRTLADLARSAAGTPAAPLLAQLRAGLNREGAGSRLNADFSLRRSGAVTTLIVPSLHLTGTSGEDVVVVSRGNLAFSGAEGLRMTGNLRTGGRGLPRITGQVERRSSGAIEARLTMPEYRAGDAAITLPQFAIVSRADGATGLAGRAVVTGPLPGGRVDRLVLPLDGIWSPRRGLALWRGCQVLRFDRLRYASLAVDASGLMLCAGPGGAILTSNARGTRFAAGAPRVALSGRLGQSAIRLYGQAVGFAWPGALTARNVAVTLGQTGTANRLTLTSLSGQLGAVPSGRFSGGEARLAAVPLDIRTASGSWRYAGGKLDIGDGQFRLEDRLEDDRFRPLIARDATLSLRDNRIAAFAALREPGSDRVVTEAAISHDLTSGHGQADLTVRGLIFDEKVQAVTLTNLALGVIANARGTVRGTGRIDWNPREVTSTGRFSTDKLDFAAAFGPVEGLSGTVHFTDLLGMVTAPDQQLKIASINPGIEVLDGNLRFQLEADSWLAVKGAEWPFAGGRLLLLPTRMRLGAADERRFTLRLDGADAARFVQQLDMSNIAATGIFDGDLPLIFDEQGGRIERGMLISRAPGGNVSYVGALTYKDMGAMANFAFQSLRSLNYRQMQIGMEGHLDGEIVTRVQIDGVTQGVGAKRNFLTREIGKLPIRFNINVRAPFQRLLHSFRSLYDPTYVRDPRDLGLVDKDGKPILQPDLPGAKPPGVQPSDSRKAP